MAGGREAPVETKQARDARFRVLGLWRRARSGRRARWRRRARRAPAGGERVRASARGRRARGWVVAFAKGGIRRAPPGCDRGLPPCGSDESRTRSRSRRRSPGRKRGGRKVGVSDARRRRSCGGPYARAWVRARAAGRGRDPLRPRHRLATSARERRSVRGRRETGGTRGGRARTSAWNEPEGEHVPNSARTLAMFGGVLKRSTGDARGCSERAATVRCRAYPVRP